MSQSTQQWELFGFDVRRLGHYLLAAWKDFLWGFDSPVRQRLDDVVLVRDPTGGEACYQSGRPTSDGEPTCNAVLLPDELVLSRQLQLPAAVEADLDQALALEVSASCPFAVDDAAWGWRVSTRDNATIGVSLAIVSRSAVMRHLHGISDSATPESSEVWAQVGGEMVVLTGFGEGLREGHYRQRLLRCAGMLGLLALLLLLLAATLTVSRRLESQQLQALAQTAQSSASAAMELRSALTRDNEIIAQVNAVLATAPNPHVELARLTELLDDTASLSNFSMRGDEIRLRGRAQDAAAVLELLTEQEAYASVRSPQAISRMGESGFEQFYLDITVAGAGEEEP